MNGNNELAYYFEHKGFCPICEKEAVFTADHPYFRNSLKCSLCDSRPRQRALMHTLDKFNISWRGQNVHEGSPGWDRLSRKIAAGSKQYTPTYFDPSKPTGSDAFNEKLPFKNYRVENLEQQTFEDETFDLIVTQDVFEHIYNPGAAIREIARTLKPGGATIMTVPIQKKHQLSERRCKLEEGQKVDLLPPVYHGNPLGGGAIVTFDWGYDIVSYFQNESGLSFIMVCTDNIDLGIRADLNEVLIGFKISPTKYYSK